LLLFLLIHFKRPEIQAEFVKILELFPPMAPQCFGVDTFSTTHRNGWHPNAMLFLFCSLKGETKTTP